MAHTFLKYLVLSLSLDVLDRLLIDMQSVLN